MSNCFEGEEIDFKELMDPNVEGFRNTLFKFLEKGINQGPYMPNQNMPLNAPNDPGFNLGMNQFWEMSGAPGSYQPYQAPQTWNNAWNPQWPNMNYNPYQGGGGQDDDGTDEDEEGTDKGTDTDHGNKGRPVRPIKA